MQISFDSGLNVPESVPFTSDSSRIRWRDFPGFPTLSDIKEERRLRGLTLVDMDRAPSRALTALTIL